MSVASQVRPAVAVLPPWVRGGAIMAVALMFAMPGGAAAVQAGSAAAAVVSDSAPDYRAALAASQAVLGTRPDAVPLRDTLHREMSLESFRGKPLLVSFVYTGCFQVCPITTQYLARAVRSMRDALGRDAFRVATIGFNQPFDGPEAMAAYARQNGIDDPDWVFLSVDAKRVGELTRQFGFSYAATPKGFDHIAQVTVIGADGVIYRQVYGDTFDLPLLAEPVKELLSGEVRRASTLDDVWTRVKLYCTVYDPVTGNYRANYSLFVEIFAGLSILGGVLLFLLSERRRRPRSA